MKIGGIIDISTKDIPRKAAMVIFTVGCNFKCGFCHNKYLLREDAGREYEIAELLKIVKSNSLINAVSISGGEPTIQEELPFLIKQIKDLEKFVSLDTNGSHPEVLQEILPFIDRVALDIKSPINPQRISEIINIPIEIEKIVDSFLLINNKEQIDFEIRTTYVENLMKPSDIEKIITFLNDNDFRGNYVVQQYQYSDGVGDKYKDQYKKPEHGVLVDILRPFNDLAFPFDIFLRDEIEGYISLEKLCKKLDSAYK
jgi:pyruvate formate lyase activating enzyme